jgi:hypothetical protein
VIVIAVLIAAGNGHQRGFWLSLLQYTGLVVGVVVGAALTPPVADFLGVQATPARPLVGVIMLFALGSAGSSLGYWLGEPIRLHILRAPTASELDSIAGAVFSILAVLSVCWFLGLSFSRGPSPALSRLIQRSTVLRFLDGLAPRPPGFLAGVEQVLAAVPFPSTFSGLEPIVGSYALPASVDTPGVQKAASETVLIRSRGVGCSGIITGSGFPVAGNHILTNAHVVAGTAHTEVISGSRTYPASVIWFDPGRDVAILNVPGFKLAPLQTANAAPGTQGATIGYPGGGPEVTTPAVVDSQVTAEGRDIYNQNLVTRQIFIIEARVQPGDSGGPLVDLQGNVLGVIFAASTSQEDRAYALTDREVSPAIDGALGRSAPVDVGQRCAV